MTFNDKIGAIAFVVNHQKDCGKAGSRVSLERGGKPTRAVLTASNILSHDAGQSVSRLNPN